MNSPQKEELHVSADAVKGSWVYSHAPGWMRPWLKLARLDRPVGAWLLLWPCLWGLAYAGMPWPSLGLLILFSVGAVVMRGAGCTYNDIVDRDFDARVARTALRPLPAGEVSLAGAWIFLLLQCSVGLAVLLELEFYYQPGIFWFGVAALVLVAAYPFMKRITYWPQAWLGLTFNFGLPMAAFAAEGRVPMSVWVLYVGGVLWTLGYDTIYAHQDKEDDVLIGVKSTALRLGAKSRIAVALFYAGFFIALLVAGYLAKLGVIYYTGVVLAGLHLAWQVKGVDFENGDSCLAFFRANIGFGWILFLALVFDRFFGADQSFINLF